MESHHEPAVGTNSRAGTIIHEMSHFSIAGGTKDHAYGPDECKAPAKTDPLLALTNADTFEFYVEGAKSVILLPKQGWRQTSLVQAFL